MLSLSAVVIVALCAYRLARLITADTITGPFRDRLYQWAWDPDHPVALDPTSDVLSPSPRAAWRTWAWELLTCQQCLGVWLTVASYAAWRWGDDVGRSIVTVAAIAGAQSALAMFVAKAEPEE